MTADRTHLTLLDDFHASAARAPEAVALRAGPVTHTYRELRAAGWAMRERLGAAVDASREDEPRVAYFGTRDAALVATVLGVMETGAAFVGIDPAWPVARQREVLRDSRARALVVGTGTAPGDVAALVGGTRAVPVVRAVFDTDTARGPAPSPRDLHPRSLAYLVFTSGSTGRPKGVLVEHASVRALIHALGERWQTGPSDVVLQFSPISVDILFEEIFVALAHGGSVSLVTDDRYLDFSAFEERLAEHRVSTLDISVDFWRAWTRDRLSRGGDAAPLAGALRVVAVGSDTVEPDDIAEWQRLGCAAGLYNMYGSTEQTVTSVVSGPIHVGDPIVVGSIGLPLGGVGAAVLDARGRELPPGVEGEQHVWGWPVSRGYQGQPALTATKYLPAPTVRGGRMYATGDICTRLTSGEFRFVGRRGRRIMAEGFTVNPEEVEAVAAEVPGVSGVRVDQVTLADRVTGLRCVLRVTDDASATADLVQAVHAHLRERLPRYCVPDRYEIDGPDRPPGPFNGRGLPLGGAAGTGTAGADAGSADAAEHGGGDAAAALWGALLGDQEFVATDDFFDLGGNSLTAARLLADLRQAGAELTAEEFFADPTLERCARALTTSRSLSAVPLPAHHDGPVPASPQQVSLLVAAEATPEPDRYHVGVAAEITGGADPDRVRDAVEAVVRLHPALRTAVRLGEHGFVQEVVADATARCDAVTVPGPADAYLADAELRAFVRRPFAVAAGDVFRARLVRGTDGTALLVMVVHHVAIDELSCRILLEEFARVHDALGTGSAAQPVSTGSAAEPARARPYASYCAWVASEQVRTAGRAMAESWHARMKGAPPVAATFPANPDPVRPATRGRQVEFLLDPVRSAELRHLFSNAGVTAFHGFLAATAVLLGRCGTERDVVLGVPFSTRRRAEFDRTVGAFVQTLPLRVDLTDAPTLRETVRRAWQATVQGMDAAITVGTDLLEGAPGAAYRCLFLFDEVAVSPVPLGEGELRPRDFPVHTSTTDMAVIVGVTDDGRFRVRFVHDADTYAESYVRRLGDRLAAVLDAFLDDLDARVDDVRFPASDLSVLRGTRVSPDEVRARPVWEQIRLQAERTPDAVAVVEGRTRRTYAEVMKAAGSVAEWLHSSKGTYVPLIAPAGWLLVSAMIGVNMSGRAFVPLDPRWPDQRIRDVVERIGCDVVLGGTPQALPAGPRVASLAEAATRGHALGPAVVRTSPTSPMYALFTSGSTGTPKVAACHHAGLVNRFAWMTREFGTEASEVVLQTTSPVHDSWVWESLWPLTTGGTTVLTAPDQLGDAAGLWRLMDAERVRTVDLVPAVLRELVRSAPSAGHAPVPRDLALVVCGGDRLPVPLAGALRSALPGVRLVNLYGPTEAAIGSVFCDVTTRTGTDVPIGRPIDNTDATVLDALRRPVPVGSAGELYLGGVCVGLGYVDDPSATRRAFVTDRSSPASGRLYRTGDRARVGLDGHLRFLGRADTQVKVDGVRVDVHEVAAALERHPAISEAAVVPHRHRPTPARLRAMARQVLSAASPEQVRRMVGGVPGDDEQGVV